MDEVTDLDEERYRFLFSRLRKANQLTASPADALGVQPRRPGARWVKRRFVVEGRAKGRIFITAYLEDNPHLGAEYEDRSPN